MTMKNTSGTLYGIELFRGLAATSVVIYHISRHIEKNDGFFPFSRITEVGYTGVDFFFVLSGFIIAYVHHSDIGRPRAIGRYFRQRFTRIYPFYWFVLLLTIALIVAGGNHVLPDSVDLARNILLAPQDHPLVGVSWSLQYEIIFYCLFACLIIDVHLGAALFALWFLANLLLVYFVAASQFTVPVLISKHTVQFFIGMAAAGLVLQQRFFAPRITFLAGLAIYLCAMTVELAGSLAQYSVAGRIVYGLGAGLLIIGCVQYEQRYGLPKPWLGRMLGRSSYSIYLTHLALNGILYKVFAAVGLLAILPIRLVAALLIIGAVTGGCLLSTWVEIPLMGWLRRRLAGPRPA
jgi:exopolysaccharide production protein ExoZ